MIEIQFGMELKKLFLRKKVEESEMPLNRDQVERALEAFNADGCAPKRLAKKLTSGTAGAVVTEMEVEQFLQNAVNDNPRWVEFVNGHWRLAKLQLIEQPVAPIESAGEEGESAVKSELTPLVTPLDPSRGQIESPNEEASVSDLVARVAEMRKDKDYPSWYIRPREDLAQLSPKVLQGILRRGNNAIELIEALRNHPEHNVFSQAHEELTKKEVIIDELEQGNEQLRLQIDELTQQRDARFTQEEMDLLVERIAELEKLEKQSPQPAQAQVDQRSTPAVTPLPPERWRRWKRLKALASLRRVALPPVLILAVAIGLGASFGWYELRPWKWGLFGRQANTSIPQPSVVTSEASKNRADRVEENLRDLDRMNEEITKWRNEK